MWYRQEMLLHSSVQELKGFALVRLSSGEGNFFVTLAGKVHSRIRYDNNSNIWEESPAHVCPAALMSTTYSRAFLLEFYSDEHLFYCVLWVLPHSSVQNCSQLLSARTDFDVPPSLLYETVLIEVSNSPTIAQLLRLSYSQAECANGKSR